MPRWAEALGEKVDVVGGNTAFFGMVRQLLARTCKFTRFRLNAMHLLFVCSG